MEIFLSRILKIFGTVKNMLQREKNCWANPITSTPFATHAKKIIIKEERPL
jgi:hypothetical protein